LTFRRLDVVENWDVESSIEATVLCSHCGKEHKFIFEEIS
jgi:hypothetical protein